MRQTTSYGISHARCCMGYPICGHRNISGAIVGYPTAWYFELQRQDSFRSCTFSCFSAPLRRRCPSSSGSTSLILLISSASCTVNLRGRDRPYLHSHMFTSNSLLPVSLSGLESAARLRWNGWMCFARQVAWYERHPS